MFGLLDALLQLVFADEDIAMDVGVIVIYGKLLAGSGTCRLNSRLSIAFNKIWWYGSLDIGIQVKPNGVLDLHGMLFQPTWTRLSATASAAATVIKLKEKVNWQPGQQVVVVTTIWMDEQQNQNEVRTIKSIQQGGYAVEVTQPLVFSHYGGPEYQAEVGLLSRNIILSSHRSTEQDQKGGHVKVEGEARIRGVQGFRLGQRNVLGAYPFHLHQIGNAYTSYVQDCSVYRSYYRCVVLRGTSHATISDNVAFDVAGNCFYLEDGVEEDNVIDHNLAAFVHVIGTPAAGGQRDGTLHKQAYDLIEPADAAAAGFYFPNAYNIITNNAASGGWAGFNFPLLPRPMNQSTSTFSPLQRPTKLFYGNSAHSSGYMWQRGACIYVGGSLWQEGGDTGRKFYSSGRLSRETRNSDGSKGWMIYNNTQVSKLNSYRIVQQPAVLFSKP
jgi:hypothetical protein